MPKNKRKKNSSCQSKEPEVEDQVAIEGGEDELERDIVPGDDCAVVGDEDFNEADDEAVDEEEDTNAARVEEEDENAEVLPEERCDNSGDDVWDDEKIPDPLSSDSDDDDEEKAERRERQRELEEPEELLVLGKTFNSADDFKLAVLRQSTVSMIPDSSEEEFIDSGSKRGEEIERDKSRNFYELIDISINGIGGEGFDLGKNQFYDLG
ncbi:DNA topoisomerase 1-like [Eutrema salsugineum]|uniref:DNA topoisomerase 1-like n=1 Tax=Eutrema salsugineum TaxID=72664 RepID=UPI000CED0834|nr:DNA topoisomerase 1-like [Eutrema salsugineum]